MSYKHNIGIIFSYSLLITSKEGFGVHLSFVQVLKAFMMVNLHGGLVMQKHVACLSSRTQGGAYG